MKTITIKQPWATLISLGEKKFETRSWPTKLRGKLAIHAGKTIDKSVCNQEPFRSVLLKHGYTIENLPLGVILATCDLKDCLPVHTVNSNSNYALVGDKNIKIKENEYEFGWYETGKYAWELDNIEILNEPIKVRGQLGLWNYPDID